MAPEGIDTSRFLQRPDTNLVIVGPRGKGVAIGRPLDPTDLLLVALEPTHLTVERLDPDVEVPDCLVPRAGREQVVS